MESKVWVITGASRGIGKAIAEAALQAGDRVIGTARQPSDLLELMETYGEQFRPQPFDLLKAGHVEALATVASETWGRIDVLVNNAGYGMQGMIEEVEMEQVRRQMEVNFFGLVDLTQRILPLMRQQGSGYIVNVSSVAGMVAFPGLGFYHASKFAVNGFTESLAAEVAPFGIKVSCVEPGPYRTDWAGPSLIQSEAMTQLDPKSPYFSKNKAIKEFYEERDGNQPGDPKQIANVLVDAAYSEAPPLHMLFGDEAIHLWNEKLERLKDPNHFSTFPHHRKNL